MTMTTYRKRVYFDLCFKKHKGLSWHRGRNKKQRVCIFNHTHKPERELEWGKEINSQSLLPGIYFHQQVGPSKSGIASLKHTTSWEPWVFKYLNPGDFLIQITTNRGLLTGGPKNSYIHNCHQHCHRKLGNCENVFGTTLCETGQGLS